MQKVKDVSYLLSYFEEKYDNWFCEKNTTKRKIIENHVYGFIENNLDDNIYINCNDSRASGLCDIQHFEEDLKRIISTLKSMKSK